jgi:hypothetical protein
LRGELMMWGRTNNPIPRHASIANARMARRNIARPPELLNLSY